MSKIKTVLWAGGNVHDFKGCGDEIKKALDAAGCFDTTYILDDMSFFASPELHGFDVMVFYNTNGEFTPEQWTNFSKFVASGKGFVGVHGAAASFKGYEEFRAFLGGWFTGHPHYRQYQVSILDPDHEITAGLDEFFVNDEQYINNYDPRVHVLATGLYKGVAHPVAWVKTWGQGRVYFLALGHDAPACQDQNFITLLQRGAVWASGKSI